MIFTLQGKYNISNLYFAVFTSFFCLLSVNADAKTYTFNSSMLNVDQRNIDLSVFESNSQLPGVYHVDIVLNGKLIERRDMEFYNAHDENGGLVLTSCLTKDMLAYYGVKIDDYPNLFTKNIGGNICGDLSVIPGATAYFDFYNQQLNLSILHCHF